MPGRKLDYLPEQGATGSGNSPLVTVVVTCYNSARYLAEALASVLAQTYPRVEIIVVDDGSSDTTASIACSYPVTYIYQQNQGVSAARNTGILHSRGRYVLFLDHDDRLLPQAIETGVKLLEEHPECAMAVGEHRYIGADGAVLGSSKKHAAGGNHYLALLQYNFIESPGSVLHRRSALSITGAFDESLPAAEDWELYLRTARQSEFITHAATVSEYRLHDCTLSSDAERMMLQTYRVLRMELPHVQGDRTKLRHHSRGVLLIQRYFGRKLTRDLIRKGWPAIPEARRKLKVLRRHYRVGFVVVVLSRLLPTSVLNTVVPPK